MARGEGEPSTKRAKLDEAKEEEEVVCFRLPPELWQKIVDENLHQNDLLAFAMTCRFFRDTTTDLRKKVGRTTLNAYRLDDLRKSGKVASHTLGWFQWVCDTFKVLPRFTMGTLVNYAALHGSVEILRWLVEDKGWETNWETGEWAGFGGSVEVLEHLRGKGYEFDAMTCYGVAQGGCLEALKFLRGLDPPCPWYGGTCEQAALGGHLEVLKFARGQDPPCPWNRRTCFNAAQGGHLDVLQFLRSQDPPCPWDEHTCFYAAREGHLDVLKWLRDQDPPCPWDGRTCASAAREGRLEVLKWLRAQNPPCPWHRSACREEAWENDHQHIVKWIDQQED